jgi:hypothetical protein
MHDPLVKADYEVCVSTCRKLTWAIAVRCFTAQSRSWTVGKATARGPSLHFAFDKIFHHACIGSSRGAVDAWQQPGCGQLHMRVQNIQLMLLQRQPHHPVVTSAFTVITACTASIRRRQQSEQNMPLSVAFKSSYKAGKIA